MPAQQEGYFTPDDMIWEVGREWALMLGGARALLMQAAHPLAVAGVHEHSNYEEDPWSRLDRTVTAVLSIVYGSREEAEETGQKVRDIHKTVNGVTKRDLGPYPKGTRYSAEDPELLMWVHATLVDTDLVVYQRFVRELSDDEQQRFYSNMKTMAKLFGVPYSYQPKDIDAFRAYMQEQLESEKICVTPPAIEIAKNVLNPRLPFGVPLRAGPLWEGVRIITAGMMPSKLRKQYGLRWDIARAAVAESNRIWIKNVILPAMPEVLRTVSAARRAEQALLN